MSPGCVPAQAVAAVKGSTATDWPSLQKMLAAPGFLASLAAIDRDHISDAAVRQLRKLLEKAVDTTPRVMTQQSKAAGALCIWCTALEKYHVALQVRTSHHGLAMHPDHRHCVCADKETFNDHDIIGCCMCK